MELFEKSTVYSLLMESELRFSVGEEVTVSLELLNGFAEIFGSQLVRNRVYTFPPYSTVSLFTWKGCRVKIQGKTEKVCVTTETLMMLRVNIHACLEEMRMVATSRRLKGPISLVVGPMQSGKTSLCRILLNYAARMGRQPLYVDLDVGHNSCSIPGAISVMPLKSQLDVVEGLNRRSAMSVFNFGYLQPDRNIKLYYLLVKKLGEMLQASLEKTSTKIRNSGVVIDTCGCVRGKGYSAITLVACAFEIDVVFVLEDETLCRQLKIDLPYCVKVVYVPKQEGVIERDTKLHTDIQANKVWEYFYGSIKAPLKPHEFEVGFSDIQIYGTEKPKESSAVSVDNAFKVGLKDVAVAPVPIGPELVNRIMAISFTDVVDENMIVNSVKGFVCIISVDMDRKVLTILSPQPGPLPCKILITGAVKLRRCCSAPLVIKRVDYSLNSKIF